MKIALMAAVALVAAPAIAQTTPQTTPPAGDQSTMTPPATTAPTTPTDPTTPADPTVATPSGAPTSQAPAAAPMTQPMTTDNAAPAPAASSGPLPYCRAGQYTGCREHSNAAGARVHRSARKR